MEAVNRFVARALAIHSQPLGAAGLLFLDSSHLGLSIFFFKEIESVLNMYKLASLSLFPIKYNNYLHSIYFVLGILSKLKMIYS